MGKTPGRGAVVSLQPITAKTVRQICGLAIAERQRANVSANAWSMAEAYFQPAAWFRAVYADECPVGFVMLYDTSLENAVPHPDYPDEPLILWRFMIDEAYQGLGYGRQAISLVKEHARTKPDVTQIVSSYVPGPNGAAGFYAGLGFKETGRTLANGTENEIILDL